MKRLRKLFNLLPAFALAFISGLGVVLDKDQTIKTANADSNYLISNHRVTNYEYSYSSSGVYFYWYFDFDINFYNDIANDNFYFVLGVKYRYSQCKTVYNNITYYARDFENNPLADASYTYVSSRFTRANANNNTNFTFQIMGTNTNTSGNFYTERGTYGNYWAYTFSQRFRFNLSSGSNFNPTSSDVSFSDGSSLDYGYIYYSFGSSTAPSAYIASSIQSTSIKNVVSYSIDYSRSNYDLGYNDGYSSGYNDGFNIGYESGNNTGYSSGYDVGYQAGVDSQQQAIDDAYSAGYSAGYDEGFSVDSTAATIFSGILQVGMLPINVLLAIFNFEILGINLSAFISAILTVCLTVIVIRTVTGGKNSE